MLGISTTMDIHPKDIAGAPIAVFIWDEDDNCGGSIVMFGIARYDQGDFFVERTAEPLQMPIPESAWQNLRVNSGPSAATTFEGAGYIVMLRLGPMPENESFEGYQKINIPFYSEALPGHDA